MRIVRRRGGQNVGTLRVVVVDDHPLTREGLRLALEDEPGIELVGEVSEGTKALPLVARLRPDVVLLDVGIPDMDGLTILDRLRAQHPDVTVVMFSGTDDPEVIGEALRRGARAFVLKSIDPSELPAAIRQAVEGPVPGALGRNEESTLAAAYGLTAKEREVLQQVALGRSNAEISRELWLSQQTVKFHLTNVYRKLGVTNRTEAARFSLRHALTGSSGEMQPRD
jgi:DNA-binding NarL/FixJ family response regulator